MIAGDIQHTCVSTFEYAFAIKKWLSRKQISIFLGYGLSCMYSKLAFLMGFVRAAMYMCLCLLSEEYCLVRQKAQAQLALQSDIIARDERST